MPLLKFEVTDEDFEGATCRHSHKCVFAKALTRVTGIKTRIDGTSAAFWMGPMEMHPVGALLPNAIRNHVYLFDNGRDFDLRHFELEVPQEVWDAIPEHKKAALP